MDLAINSALKFSEELAIQAGKLLTDYFQPEGVDARVKADHTVVTDADLAADRFLQEAIRASYPQDQILTEEGDNPGIDPGKPLWVIDPLDGTTNFTLGLQTWGVSIARLVNGFPDTAALYFPLHGELYSAQRGAGAFFNQRPLTVRPLPANMPTAFFTASSTSLRHFEMNVRYKFRMLGSAAYDFCLIARGAAISGFQSIPKIWDIAAGWLVLEEAGGVVHLYPEGSPFPYFADQQAPEATFALLMAANPEVAAKVLPKIRPLKG